MTDVVEDLNVHTSGSMNVIPNHFECKMDVKEEPNNHSSDSENFTKSEIMELKLECEMLKADKLKMLDQLEQSFGPSEILKSRGKVENLEKINQDLKVPIEENDISKFIVNNHKRCKFYTGIHTYEKFVALFDFFKEVAPKPHPLEVLTHFQQFVLTLVRLRLMIKIKIFALKIWYIVLK